MNFFRRPAAGAWANALGRRVIAWTLLWSCLLAALSAAVQVYALYRRELAQVATRMETVQHSSLAGLSFAVWNLDQAQIDAQLAGLRLLPDVSYLAVHDLGGRTLAAWGAHASDGVLRDRFPISVGPAAAGARREGEPLGELVIETRLDGLYGRLGHQAWSVLAGQAATIFLGSWVMLLLFRHLVSRPLADVARQAGEADLARLGQPIVLDRPSHRPDDLDTLVSAMNRMRLSLKDEVDHLHQARDALATSEARYRNLVESTNVIGWTMDAGSGRLGYVGPQVERLLGVSDRTWREQGFGAATVDAEDLPRVQAALASQAGRLDLECRLVAADGGRRWFAVTGERHGDGPGRPVWHGHLIDIDARKRTELALAASRQELEQRVAERTRELAERLRELEQQRQEQARLFADLETARNQAMQSDRLAAIGQLAAGVAHEINNPVGFVLSNFGTLERYVADLFAVLGAYERLEAGLASAHPGRDEVAAAREAADLDFLKEDVTHLLTESRDGLDRVRRIVQDLKECSHAGGTGWQSTDLVRGLESTLNVVRNEIKYKAEVVRRYEPLPPVRCLPSQINQVFMNLLVNAAQAIEERGTITVACGTRGEEVWVEIADTGRGMAPEVLKRIFDPFYTTKPVGQGTGLGLSISLGIVQRHHGRLDVDSRPGEGTRFRVWLPVHPPETDEG